MSYAEYLAQQKVAQEEAKVRLMAALPALREAGIGQLIFIYYGSGDDGGIEEHQALDLEGQEIEGARHLQFGPAPRGVQSLEDDVYELIPSGYENNDGGGGQFILDAVNGELRLEHYDNIVVQEETTTVFHADGREEVSEPTTSGRI